MGARTLYKLMCRDPQDQELLEKTGRDKFETLLLSNGLRVQKPRNYRRTTRSGAFRFPNKVTGKHINDLNLVWVSDITFFRIGRKFYFLTSMLDVYSRRLLGYAWANTLCTEQTTMPALMMAIDLRGIEEFIQLILHSDGGGQYYDDGFVKLKNQYHIDSSMGKQASENPFAERFNGTWKNDYLIPWGINSQRELHNALKKFYFAYNYNRPHKSLMDLTPVAFENLILKIPLSKRPSFFLK